MRKALRQLTRFHQAIPSDHKAVVGTYRNPVPWSERVVRDAQAHDLIFEESVDPEAPSRENMPKGILKVINDSVRIMVHPSFQREGIATSLIHEAQNRHDHLMAHVDQRNPDRDVMAHILVSNGFTMVAPWFDEMQSYRFDRPT